MALNRHQFDPERFSNTLRQHLADTGLELGYGHVTIGGKVFPAMGHHFLQRNYLSTPERDDLMVNMEIPHESGVLTGFEVSRQANRPPNFGLYTRWHWDSPDPGRILGSDNDGGLRTHGEFVDPQHLAHVVSEHLSQATERMRREPVSDEWRQFGASELEEHRQQTHRTPEYPLTGSWLNVKPGNPTYMFDDMHKGRFSRNLKFYRELGQGYEE